jgi:hypothetical protein
MTPDYGHGYYKIQSLNRKRQIIDRTVNELHNIQLEMIDEAVNKSDLQQAKELIAWIASK